MKHHNEMNKKCPWCESENTQTHLWLKDEFLTNEDFQIQECLKCGLLFTLPRLKPDETKKYYQSPEYYSHQENKTGFVPKLYEKVKTVNLKHKYTLATSGKRAGTALDIGCGTGDFLQIMENNNWKCIGIEPTENARAIAENRIAAEILWPQEQEKLSDESFDVITMWHVLEHVEDLRWQVKQLVRLTKPGGRIILALPNYKSYDAEFYKEKWAAYDVPRHLNHFNQNTIVNILSINEIIHVKTEKLVWDAYYISYMSEKYKRHSMPLLKGLCRGLLSNLKARRSGEWSSLVYIFEKKP